MTQSKFFAKDPIIDWRGFLCPICGEKTGPKSQCEKKAPPDMPEHKRKILTQEGVLPIYSPACIYKKSNMWEANLNYPVSQPLADRICQIEGIEKFIPVHSYKFTISIGSCFKEDEVKKSITQVYKTFIKEMQVLEGRLDDRPIEDKSNLVGIKLPNGKVVRFGDLSKADLLKQRDIVSYILGHLDDAEQIDNPGVLPG